MLFDSTTSSTNTDETLLGRTAELMDNKPLAIEAYQRTLYYNKDSVDALRCIASVLRADDKYEEAVEYIKTLLALNPNDGESHSSLGMYKCTTKVEQH